MRRGRETGRTEDTPSNGVGTLAMRVRPQVALVIDLERAEDGKKWPPRQLEHKTGKMNGVV
jgi:hypothetical protein